MSKPGMRARRAGTIVARVVGLYLMVAGVIQSVVWIQEFLESRAAPELRVGVKNIFAARWETNDEALWGLGLYQMEIVNNASAWFGPGSLTLRYQLEGDEYEVRPSKPPLGTVISEGSRQENTVLVHTPMLCEGERPLVGIHLLNWHNIDRSFPEALSPAAVLNGAAFFRLGIEDPADISKIQDWRLVLTGRDGRVRTAPIADSSVRDQIEWHIQAESIIRRCPFTTKTRAGSSIGVDWIGDCEPLPSARLPCNQKAK